MHSSDTMNEGSNISQISSHEVNDDEVFKDFETFVEQLERDSPIAGDGAIKVIISASIRKNNSNAAIKDFLKNVTTMGKTISNLSIRCHYTSGFWHSTAEKKCTSDEKETFWRRTTQHDRYNADTCCSTKLKQSSDILCDHYFNHLLPKHSNNSDTDTGKLLLSLKTKGDALLKKYVCKKETEPIYGINESVPPVKKCTCRECKYTISAYETCSSDDEAIIQIGTADEEAGTLDGVDEEKGFSCKDMLYGNGKVRSSNPIFITGNLSLSRLGNLLNLMPKLIPGLHIPYLYFGRLHSWFPVHVEDALLWSANYLHVGAPKIWFIIPPWATALLDFHLDKMKMSTYHNCCRNLLGHKCYLPSVNWLRERKIPFKMVIQYPGDLIIIHPNAAHFGFNMGYNVAEAVNFATKSWIPYGINAPKCVCYPDQVHLDVGPFVAAFRKDLLQSFVDGAFIPTKDLHKSLVTLASRVCNVDIQEDNISVKDDEASSSQKERHTAVDDTTILCPMPHCNKPYSRDRKKSLISHISNKHLPFVVDFKLLEQVEERWQKKSKFTKQ